MSLKPIELHASAGKTFLRILDGGLNIGKPNSHEQLEKGAELGDSKLEPRTNRKEPSYGPKGLLVSSVQMEGLLWAASTEVNDHQ